MAAVNNAGQYYYTYIKESEIWQDDLECVWDLNAAYSNICESKYYLNVLEGSGLINTTDFVILSAKSTGIEMELFRLRRKIGVSG